MPDAKDFAPNNPVYERSAPEPKYKRLSLTSWFEDSFGIDFDYSFSCEYYYFDNYLRIVNAVVSIEKKTRPAVTQLELQNIISYDIRHEFDLSLRESIIFETKIEIKEAKAWIK